MTHNNNFAGVMRQIFALLLAKVPADIAGQDAFQLVHSDVAMLRQRILDVYNRQPIADDALRLETLAEGIKIEVEQGAEAHVIQAMSDADLVALGRKVQA